MPCAQVCGKALLCGHPCALVCHSDATACDCKQPCHVACEHSRCGKACTEVNQTFSFLTSKGFTKMLQSHDGLLDPPPPTSAPPPPKSFSMLR
jgi:hypothetical protein